MVFRVSYILLKIISRIDSSYSNERNVGSLKEFLRILDNLPS